MESAIGVLCARVRVEEKRLIEMLVAAGVAASAFPPCSEPMPLGPNPPQPFAAGCADGVSTGAERIVVDRCQDRIMAAAVIPLLKAAGARMIDAGIAATGDRLAIVAALNGAGIARPLTLLAASEASGLAAVDTLGMPSTLLPLNPGSASIVLRDREVAEAVFEHRNVLGRSQDAVSLIQKGVAESGRMLILVADGEAIAYEGDDLGSGRTVSALALAEAASIALNAGLLAVEVAAVDGSLVVWDVQPVPEYRGMRPLAAQSTEEALRTVIARHGRSVSSGGLHLTALMSQETLDGVVLSA